MTASWQLVGPNFMVSPHLVQPYFGPTCGPILRSAIIEDLHA